MLNWNLKSRLCGTIFDVPQKRQKISDLEAKSLSPNFWDDASKAGAVLKQLEGLKNEVAKIEGVEQKLEDISEMAKIIDEEAGEELSQLDKELEEISKEIDSLEFATLFSGEYDSNDAILAIHSGAGGVDAQDWAEMLLRMYLRFCEKNNFAARIVEQSRGGEAGIKSATIEIEGRYAYGKLKSEAGVHRLVRLSPFNADNLRQTSFALVEILPVIDEIAEVKIEPKDITIDTYRASGAGGQHVNTTDSAVRITHLPSGIVVTCQSERSQMQNKEQAMKVLKARLHQKYLEEQEAEKRKLRGEHQSAEWGSQIRSYVVHPYKMVKDHRTKFETTETEKVLAGEIDEFVESYLRWVAGGEKK